MKTKTHLTKTIRLHACLILFAIILQHVVGVAQPLDKSSKDASPPANWIKTKDTIYKGFPKEYCKDVKKILDSMEVWLADSLNQIDGFGTSAPAIEWHALYFPKPEILPYIATYEMKATVQTGIGTGLLTIAANDLSNLGQPLLLNGYSHLLIGSLEQKDSGIYSTEWKKPNDDSTRKPKMIKSWLICFADSLPYVLVNRREYFEEALKELKTSKDSIKEEIRRQTHGKNAQQEEAYRKSELETIANSFKGNDCLQREREFWLVYKPDSVFEEDTLNVRAALIIEKTKLIQSLLESLKDLNKPAFVSVPAAEFEGLEDGLPGARMLCRLRPGYFRKNIQPGRPQFLVLSWQYDSDNVDAAKLGETIGKELNLIALRNVLQQKRPFYSPVKKDRYHEQVH